MVAVEADVHFSVLIRTGVMYVYAVGHRKEGDIYVIDSNNQASAARLMMDSNQVSA
jgi:hypothetical protein